jgi:predicted DNA-binding transcriptional regulator AlpA
MLIRFVDLAPKKGVTYSRVHLMRLVRSGQFPQPIRVGANRICWSEAEIDDHLQRLADQRAPRPAQ